MQGAGRFGWRASLVHRRHFECKLKRRGSLVSVSFFILTRLNAEINDTTGFTSVHRAVMTVIYREGFCFGIGNWVMVRSSLTCILAVVMRRHC